MIPCDFNTPFGRKAVTAGSPLTRLDKPAQRQQLDGDVSDYLSTGHRICQCPPGTAEYPLTLSDYQEGEVLLLIHGGHCV